MAGYPTDWPADCPSFDAEKANGTVYRVCKESPPLPEDFQSHAELGKHSQGSECMRRGLSVFKDRKEADHLTRLFPKLGKLVLRGTLEPGHARIKATPSKKHPSHTTWWHFCGIERARPFLLDSEV